MDEDKFELHVVDFSGMPGAAEYRAKLERERAEARRRYVDYLAAVIVGTDGTPDPAMRANAILDALTVWKRFESEELCRCSCHPRLPETDHHDFGFACTCMQSPEERRRRWDEWIAERDAYWESPAGVRSKARDAADEAELRTWLDADPGVVVRRHGGWAPEQWEGSVDGHSFYFRERHDEWRIELDLRPSGQVSKVWVGGDLGSEESFESREVETGDVIADGTTNAGGYGTNPAQRIQFIADVIRTYLARQECTVHTTMKEDLEFRLGDPVEWCPACGARL